MVPPPILSHPRGEGEGGALDPPDRASNAGRGIVARTKAERA